MLRVFEIRGFLLPVVVRPNRRHGVELLFGAPDIAARTSLLEVRASVRTQESCLGGGEGGIRTHEGITLHAFQACALVHYATSPWVGAGWSAHTGSRYLAAGGGEGGIRTHVALNPRLSVFETDPL